MASKPQRPNGNGTTKGPQKPTGNGSAKAPVKQPMNKGSRKNT